MYEMFLGSLPSVLSLRKRATLSPLSHVSCALNSFALLFFCCRNFFSCRNENEPLSSQLPRRPMVSASAVLPLPLFPIIATRPGLIGMEPENHSSFNLDPSIFLNLTIDMYFVLFTLIRSNSGGVSPIQARRGSLFNC